MGDPPRAKGAARLTARRSQSRHGASVIEDLRMGGSLKLLFPRSDDAALQAVLINTAGGVTGGDHFEFEACAQTGAALSLTTQAAERAYKARAGEIGVIENSLKAKDKASLYWLPQETIIFEGSNLKRTLNVDLGQSAKAVLAETLVFGRAAMGETITDAKFHDRIEVTRDGCPLFIDQIDLRTEMAARLHAKWGCDGAGALATILVVGDQAERLLPLVRDLLPDTGGASLLQADLLVARILARDSFEMRKATVPILKAATSGDLPRPWMI